MVRWGWVHVNRILANGNGSESAQRTNCHHRWSAHVSANFSGIGTASPVPTAVENPTGQSLIPFSTRRPHGDEIWIKLK